MKTKRFLLAVVFATMAFTPSCLADDLEIGNQIWMAKNLDIDVPGSECYDDDPGKCEEYGRLYDWTAAMKACPGGWHLPTDEEWEELINFLRTDAGKKLKAKNPQIYGWDGVDRYRFSALPGGAGDLDGNFNGVGMFGYWWSTTEHSNDDAISRTLRPRDNNLNREIINKDLLLSVRCIQ